MGVLEAVKQLHPGARGKGVRGSTGGEEPILGATPLTLGQQPSMWDDDGESGATGMEKPSLVMRHAPSPPHIAEAVSELQSLVRHRNVILAGKQPIWSFLLHQVANDVLHYNPKAMTPTQRKGVFAEAEKVIREMCVGEGPHASHRSALVFRAFYESVRKAEELQALDEKQIVRYAAMLPVAEWVQAPERNGISLEYIGVVVGELGDVATYTNPGKIWRRMGCAPFTKDGKTLMGSTWRSKAEGTLSSADWTEFGYSKRRRSVAFMIGANVMKQNFTWDGVSWREEKTKDEATGKTVTKRKKVREPGPYRRRYDQAKAAAAVNHMDWPLKRCDSHAMLLATKMFLRDMWVAWRKALGTWQPDEWCGG